MEIVTSFGLAELPQAITALDFALKYVADKEAEVRRVMEAGRSREAGGGPRETAARLFSISKSRLTHDG